MYAAIKQCKIDSMIKTTREFDQSESTTQRKQIK